MKQFTRLAQTQEEVRFNCENILRRSSLGFNRFDKEGRLTDFDGSLPRITDKNLAFLQQAMDEEARGDLERSLLRFFGKQELRVAYQDY